MKEQDRIKEEAKSYLKENMYKSAHDSEYCRGKFVRSLIGKTFKLYGDYSHLIFTADLGNTAVFKVDYGNNMDEYLTVPSEFFIKELASGRSFRADV